MLIYRVFKPGEQEAFPYLDNNCVNHKTSCLEKLEQASLRRLAREKSAAFLNRRPRQNTPSIELAAKIIKESLDNEFQFGLENQWLFKCFLISKRSELAFFPSHRPNHLTEENWGWMQRRILVLRRKDKFWIFPPKP